MSFDPWDFLERARPDVVDAWRRSQSVVGRQLSPRERLLVRFALATQARSRHTIEAILDEAAEYEIEPDALLDTLLCVGSLAGTPAVTEALAILVERHPELDPAADEEEAGEALVTFAPTPPEIEDPGPSPEERSASVPLAELPETGGKVVEIGRRRIALFRSGDSVHAVDDLCPHQDAPLAGGHVEDGEVVCPWHGWRFELETGRCDLVPEQCLTIHCTELRDDRVVVTLRETDNADELS